MIGATAGRKKNESYMCLTYDRNGIPTYCEEGNADYQDTGTENSTENFYQGCHDCLVAYVWIVRDTLLTLPNANSRLN